MSCYACSINMIKAQQHWPSLFLVNFDGTKSCRMIEGQNIMHPLLSKGKSTIIEFNSWGIPLMVTDDEAWGFTMIRRCKAFRHVIMGRNIKLQTCMNILAAISILFSLAIYMNYNNNSSNITRVNNDANEQERCSNPTYFEIT